VNDMMALVQPMIPALRRYARSLLRDREAADDLVQDCLEKVIVSWHLRRADGNARTWVFTILHILAINQMRRTKRRGSHVTLDALPPIARNASIFRRLSRRSRKNPCRLNSVSQM
jgi:DNA-directed RNA polymerase specialized sigma24 family protein